MEFTFKYNSPERALLRKQALQTEIDQYDTHIAEIQRQRIEALDELAALQTMLLQNGHAAINIPQKALAPVPTAQQLAAPEALKPQPATSNLPEYDTHWSLREKIIYVYLLENPKAEWTTDEIKAALLRIEPDNDKVKNLTTIVGQNIDKSFTRINKDGSKPLYKLMKGAEKFFR